MGLGKTLQTLSVMCLDPKPALVILEGAVKKSWKDDAESFFEEGTFDVLDWGGGGATKDWKGRDLKGLENLPSNLVVLTTPTTMRNHVLLGSSDTGYSLNSEADLVRAKWGRIVFDEAQELKTVTQT